MKFQLGEWTVEENANLLFQSDARVRIEKRVMAVLIELIAANGAVVTKDALLKAVWQGAIVSDHSIANAVSDLRRALGDDRRNPRYIETIPKRGYRLLVDVEELRHGENPDTVGARYVSAGAYRTAVAVVGVFFCTAALIVWFWPSRETPPRLLLPNIENATGNPQWDIAGETATELLTVALAGGDYRLIRWRASGLDEGRDEKLLSEEMHLRARDRVLVGRIILDGEEPILTLQLVDWTDRASVWAGAYPLDAARYGALSESIVANIKEPLGLVDPRGAYSAADPVVFEAYWRARYLWNLREHQAILDALRILTNIVEQAPDYAPAHAALADIYAHKTAEELALDRWETYEIAERHLAHALALDPDLSEALVTRAYLSFFRDRDTQAAMLQIDKAIDLRPENAVAWQTKAMIASAAGAFGTSLDAIDQARALDPLSASMLWDQVWFLYIAERYDEALDATVHARRVSAPVSSLVPLYR